jgi:hypothetical protein
MASGLIYLIILGMWAAYFLPRWLSHHDTQSGKANERYKSAMKIVASTPNTPDSIDPVKKLRTLRQRRIIFSALAGALLATLGLIAFGVLPYLAILIPTTALAIDIAHVRRQILNAQLKKRRLAALAIITTAEIKLDPAVRIDLSLPDAKPETKLNSKRAEADEQWIPLLDRVESSSITIIPKEDKAWSPISVPRPTYTTAPKAVRSKRVIDLTIPGQWTAEQERQVALELPTRDELFDQEVAEQAAAARDWAVNE